MFKWRFQNLDPADLLSIHDASLRILRDTGVLIPHPEFAELLVAAGARSESAQPIVHLPEDLVMNAIQGAGKQYVLHGRDGSMAARFGHGDLSLLSSPGQSTWLDWHTGKMRPATQDDTREAIHLADSLSDISIVGALAQPADIDPDYRELWLTATLLKGTRKPSRTWVSNVASARGILELYRTVSGGAAALRARPMSEGFLTPISPLQFPSEGLEVVREFVRAGQPVCIASMPMSAGTAPATLAGALALCNAEILAGVVITQLIGPGAPILYGGIPHILDPRSTLCSFGAPEQALMATAMTQLGRHYGFPVYINVGLTDANTLDAQAGIEKGSTLALGALAGADLFGHAGICGADHGASLLWLCADHELMSYVKRLARGFEIDADTLATDIIAAVKPGGHFLTQDHTLDHFRQELWSASAVWNRQSFTSWEAAGKTTFTDRLRSEIQRLLSTPQSAALEPTLARELDQIITRAAHGAGFPASPA